METVTVRIPVRLRDTVRELAEAMGVSMQDVISKAIEQYRQEQLIAQANAAYAALRADPKQNAEYEADLKSWDSTLQDGLDPNEVWNENGTVKRG